MKPINKLISTNELDFSKLGGTMKEELTVYDCETDEVFELMIELDHLIGMDGQVTSMVKVKKGKSEPYIVTSVVECPDCLVGLPGFEPQRCQTCNGTGKIK